MDAFSTLLATFLDDEGTLKYPVADVEYVVPWMLVNLPIDLGALDEDTLVKFAEASARAGVTDDMDASAIRATFDKLYQEHPPSPQIVTALQEAWRRVNEGEGPAAFTGFLGEKQASGVLGGGERPQGTVPAALARLASFGSDSKKRR